MLLLPATEATTWDNSIIAFRLVVYLCFYIVIFMQFRVSSTLLLKHLSRISGVFVANPVVSILDNFLFVLQQNELSVIVYDLEIRVKTKLKVDSADSGSYCVPRSMLMNGLKNCPDQPLEFIFNPEHNSLKVRHNSGSFQILCEDAKNYPEAAKLAPEKQQFEVPFDIMLASIHHTISSTNNNELRPALAGVHFEFYANRLRVVATDSYQLAYYTNYKVQNPTLSEGIAFTIRQKPVSIIKNLLKDSDEYKLSINYDTHNIFLDINYTEEIKGNKISFEEQVIIRLMSHEYPNYEAIIPRDEQCFKATFDRRALLQGLGRSVNFANSNNHCICLQFFADRNDMILYSSDIVAGHSSKDSLPVNYDGKDFKIGLNGKILAKILDIMPGEEIVFLMTMPDKSIRIYPQPAVDDEEPFALLQPITISEEESANLED